MSKDKTRIPDDGYGGQWAKRRDSRMNYGTKADTYQGETTVKREAATKRPPV